MEELTDKKYYNISEVSQKLELPQHVLRFWESKFVNIKPKRTRGRRYYSHETVKQIEHVKDLLYRQKMTISQAQNEIKHYSQLTLTSQDFEANSHNTRDSFLVKIDNLIEKFENLLNQLASS